MQNRRQPRHHSRTRKRLKQTSNPNSLKDPNFTQSNSPSPSPSPSTHPKLSQPHQQWSLSPSPSSSYHHFHLPNHSIMSSNQRSGHPHPLATLRKSISFLFLSMLFLYLLYSSKLLFLHNPTTTIDDPDISTTIATTTTTTDDTTTTPIDCTSQIAAALANYTSLQLSPPPPMIQPPQPPQLRFDTQVNHVVFGIAASSNLWDTRKEYIKLWWRPGETRGVVWVDQKVKTARNEKLPDIRISGDTSMFPYTNRQGLRSALRISRVVSETLRLGLKDVRWFVMGDDDTVFVVDNVVRILSKYDHNQFYYIGSSSESHVQNILFSYAMAYGGGGFAISYPLARELEKMQDRCIHRYPGLYGSDDRIQACMAELGVPLTKEPGFHQYDVYGNLLGLLGAHPVTPLVSLHHLDVVDPIFPGMTRVQSLQRLFESAKYDSASLIQQSFCYDKKKEWSISVSWGYTVQIVRGIISPRELETPTRTFLNWYKRLDYTAYAFNTRPVTRHPCQKPFVYYMASTRYDERRRQIIGVYNRHKDRYPYCRWRMESPEKINTIVVLKREDSSRWSKSPRKDCCRVLPSRQKATMYLWVGNCRQGEVIEL